MGVVITCTTLVLVGLGLTVRWRGLDLRPPSAPLEAGAPIADVARRYLWWIAVTLYTAIATALLIVGPAGRLAMRILAATAGSAAQGRVTEADEIVGRVTVGGTLGLFIFVGLFFGVAAAVGYVLIHRWLPGGTPGGALYAFVLLMVVATRVDPLRQDNPDFDIVGPGWLAMVVYALMILIEGLALAAFAGWISRRLPEISKRPIVLLAYLPVALPFLTGLPGAVIVLGFGVALIATRSHKTLRALRSRPAMVAARIGLALVVLASMPAAVPALIDIAGRP